MTQLHRPGWGARLAVGPLAIALVVAGAACQSIARSRRPPLEPTRPRAFVTTFDRLLIAGFVAGTVPDRGRDLDLNAETARLLRTALRSRASMDVLESQPVHLPQSDLPTDFTAAYSEEALFKDVGFWKRLGEEYRQPLILTGIVDFRRAGSQSVERHIGPRTIPAWRPRFRLRVRLIFICGRTGQVLESLSLGPEALQAPDDRASALAVYFQLMDRLTPGMLAFFGP